MCTKLKEQLAEVHRIHPYLFIRNGSSQAQRKVAELEHRIPYWESRYHKAIQEHEGCGTKIRKLENVGFNVCLTRTLPHLYAGKNGTGTSFSLHILNFAHTIANSQMLWST
jgi:hypothetical protein